MYGLPYGVHTACTVQPPAQPFTVPAHESLPRPLLSFDAQSQPLYESDGLLLTAPDATGTERVLASGAWSALSHKLQAPDARA